MGTKNNPGKYDCYVNAEPDEPMFVLLARDESAADLVRMWAENRLDLIERNGAPESDRKKCEEAFKLADDMGVWRKSNR